MIKTNFNLRHSTRGKEAIIYLVCNFAGTRIRISTGRRVRPEYWNKKKQVIKANPYMSDVSQYNDKLRELQQLVIRAYNDFELTHGRIPTLAEFHGLIEAKKDKPLFELWEQFIMQSKDGSWQGYKRTRELVQEYKPGLTFAQVTMEFYYDFVRYMERDKKYAINTVGSHIKNLKIFLNYATDIGANKYKYYKNKKFRMLYSPAHTIYLTEEELQGIYDLDLEDQPPLERVRDLFILGARTGLRYSDFTRIRAEHFRGGKIHINVSKTNRLTVIPVHPWVYALLEKYGGDFPDWDVSNRIMNDIIKKIAALVEALNTPVKIKKTKGGRVIWEDIMKYDLVTTHTARRSCLTNLFLGGAPVYSIMALSGHRTERDFLLYLRLEKHEHADLIQEQWDKKKEG